MRNDELVQKNDKDYETMLIKKVIFRNKDYASWR